MFKSPEGRTENSPGLQAWEGLQKENRPERAADCRALFPKKPSSKASRLAFQNLTNLFLVRKSKVMFGLIANVGAISFHLRLGWQLRFFKYTRRFRSEFPQNAGTLADLSARRPHAQLAANRTGASALRNKLTIRFKLNRDSAALSGRFSLYVVPRPEGLGYPVFALRAIGARSRKCPNPRGSSPS
jgi:hypothetical protein